MASSKNSAAEALSAGYVALPESKKNTFAKICNKLLSDAYLYGQMDEDHADYYSALEMRDLIAAYFSLIGYTLNHVDTQKIFYLESETVRNRVHFKKMETVLLLLLRLAYYSKSRIFDANSNIDYPTEELVGDLQKTGIFADHLGKTELLDALKTLKRHKLINFTYDNGEIGELVQIYPTIALLIKASDVEELNAKLNVFLNQQGEQSNEIE